MPIPISGVLCKRPTVKREFGGVTQRLKDIS